MRKSKVLAHCIGILVILASCWYVRWDLLGVVLIVVVGLWTTLWAGLWDSDGEGGGEPY